MDLSGTIRLSSCQSRRLGRAARLRRATAAAELGSALSGGPHMVPDQVHHDARQQTWSVALQVVCATAALALEILPPRAREGVPWRPLRRELRGDAFREARRRCWYN